jgi:uncharacterized membrane protein YoaK (UPF0700 family)
MPLWQLVLLAANAGCFDALSLTTADVFTANMTGNTIILAVACVRGDSPRSLFAAAALLAYLAGVGAGARIGQRRPRTILVVEVLLAALYASRRVPVIGSNSTASVRSGKRRTSSPGRGCVRGLSRAVQVTSLIWT